MEVVLNFFLIIVGFVLLIKGADFLVNGASSLAKRFNVSDIAIGLTVVAMGTSAPELVVNIISGSVSHDVVFGNIIGSNVFNIFLILGVSATIYPLTVQKNALWKEIPYSLLATAVFFILVNDVIFFEKDTNTLSFYDSIVLLVMFALFLIYIFMNLTRHPDEAEELEEIVVYSSMKTTIMIILGIAGLIFGGKMIVDNAVSIAELFGVSEKLIGLTILAAGTSLPELATSAVAAYQKKSDLAIGNIVGSNIFNLLLVLGVTGMIHSPLTFNVVLNMDMYMVILGTLLLFVFMFTFAKQQVDRAEGLIYLIGFFVYMLFLFDRELAIGIF
ncbi:calcium/sodium antiporter [Marinoscillum sp. MHG1-6]|uniref:calcium/sodium antiporter n=1 Tax=Marinoscillum sp. MHG1-6 TaxID=2959627 RepID=UPI002157788E|nr:calcium/sodium antiporter [Marinoscillum sp. MHG1-6]